MATKFNFDNKLIQLPGVYTRIASGVDNSPQNFTYGNILIIDKDPLSEFGGGSGVDGELSQGEDSIYSFSSIREFREFDSGGKYYDLALPLFRPFGTGSTGVSKIYYIKALATTAAVNTLTMTNGALEFKAKHEGLVGNGALSGTNLSQGFAVTIEAGLVDSAKFKFKFWRGTFTGLDAAGRPYNGISAGDSQPIVVAQTPEVSDIQEVIDWTAKNTDFLDYFTLVSSTAGVIDPADLVAFSTFQLFAGGTQATNVNVIDQVLDAVGKLDYSHVLAPDSGADAASTDNLRILSHLVDEARFGKIMVVAGGDTKSDFKTVSVPAANTFNSERVVVVHGGIYEADKASGGSGLRQKPALNKAAYVLGRTSGLTPQTPPTFKGLGYAGEVHKVSDREREFGLDNGVLTTYYDTELTSFTITQGINTLQNNENVVNEDGSSHQWQLMRISFQLNKELEIQAKLDLFGNQNSGPNRSTVNAGVIEEWAKSFLQTRTATETNDNLILSFQDITVGIKADAFFLNYAFVPNFEINKAFVTGLLLDPNS